MFFNISYCISIAVYKIKSSSQLLLVIQDLSVTVDCQCAEYLNSVKPRTNDAWNDWFHKGNVSIHYKGVIMGTIASQITSLTIVYSTVYSDADQRKHQSSASLAFVRGIHRGPVNSPHKWPVTQKVFPFDDVIICLLIASTCTMNWFFRHMLKEYVGDQLGRIYSSSLPQQMTID